MEDPTLSAFDYVLDSMNECNRLELQAAIDGLDRHLRHLPRLSQARILDAGCGSGALARTIASSHPHWEVVGVDLNPSYIAYAQGRGREAQLDNLAFMQGNLQALSFAAATFDIIWSRFVLYFLPDPGAAIAEFKRVIRPNGRIVVTLHSLSSMINYPEDPSLQDRQRRVFDGLADMCLAPKLPSMMLAGGFRDISVEIELDRIYSTLGQIEPSSRKNIEDVFKAGINRITDILGSRDEADLFVRDSLNYLDRNDTYTYSLLWTIKGSAPGSP